MLKLTDLRKTTRKASEYRIVYPHLLRDRTLNPRIELAIRYMESMLGKRRSELDQEVNLRRSRWRRWLRMASPTRWLCGYGFSSGRTSRLRWASSVAQSVRRFYVRQRMTWA